MMNATDGAIRSFKVNPLAHQELNKDLRAGGQYDAGETSIMQ